MDAEEADRAGECWNCGGHGAEVRGTPAVRRGRAAFRQGHPAGVHGSILAGRAGPWLDGVVTSRCSVDWLGRSCPALKVALSFGDPFCP
jgi:hypothetical protein